MSAGKQKNTPEIEQATNYAVGGAYAKAAQALKAAQPHSGTVAAKPGATTVPVGFEYFATDHLILGAGSPIWSDGAAWHDATGAAVA